MRADPRLTEDGEDTLAELLAEVRRIEVQSKRLVTDVMAGGYSSVFRGPGIEFDEVREYVEGDDPRRVDWNVTARMGRPFIKKYVDERELTVVFLLDLSASMSGAIGSWSLRQAAARICACLALSAVRNNDRVGLIAFSDAVERYVPPEKGAGHALRIVRDCLVMKGGRRTQPAVALDFASSVLRRRAVLFLVSDFMADDWRTSLVRCSRRHDVVAVRLLPPELAEPPEVPMRLRDPEGGRPRVVDWTSPRLREDYAARVATWRARTENDLRSCQVDLMDVPIPFRPDAGTVARPIMRFFRMRERRGEKR